MLPLAERSSNSRDLGMVRGAVLTLALVLAIPMCLAIGGTLGFYLLFVLYVVFGIDFPTEISILVGLVPVVLSLVALVAAVSRLKWR